MDKETPNNNNNTNNDYVEAFCCFLAAALNANAAPDLLILMIGISNQQQPLNSSNAGNALPSSLVLNFDLRQLLQQQLFLQQQHQQQPIDNAVAAVATMNLLAVLSCVSRTTTNKIVFHNSNNLLTLYPAFQPPKVAPIIMVFKYPWTGFELP